MPDPIKQSFMFLLLIVGHFCRRSCYSSFPLLLVFLIFITFSAEKFIYHFQALYCPISQLPCFTPSNFHGFGTDYHDD